MKATKMCIVGAGPSGLMTARAFRHAGIPFDVIEKHSDVGGLWDINNPGTAVYEAAHFISSRTLSGFPDYPMPDDYPDYPSQVQIDAYIKSFAKAYDLYGAIRFGLLVQAITPNGDGSWQVTTSDGMTQTYRGVVCCNGALWSPNIPVLQGQFTGTIRHTQTFKKSDEFRGKRVLVVGGGNSGVDIACEAATFADAAFLSLRRGYTFIPKYIFGKPADVFASEGPKLPRKLEQWFFKTLLRVVVGDQTKFGLPKPDHKLLESHPVLNSDVFNHLGHGKLHIKPDIDFVEGTAVVFKDGSRETIDEIILATGYHNDIPFAQQWFDWEQRRPKLYLQLFNRKYMGLFVVGLLETNSAGYELLTEKIMLLTNYLQADTASRAKFESKIATDHPDLLGGLHLIKSTRHVNYVDSDTYRSYIKKLQQWMSWQPYKKGMYKPMLENV